jgi:lipopolysaccharide assembly outer membrane protein LptD (OstA)
MRAARALIAALLFGALLGVTAAAADEAEPLEVSTGPAGRVSVSEDGRHVAAEGGVEIGYRDYHARADRVTADLETSVVQLEGSVELTREGEVFRGEHLTFHLDTEAWQFGEATSTLSPDLFDGYVLEPLYLRGEKAAGDPNRIEIERASATSCSLPDPHYHLEARRITIYPKSRLIAKQVSFWAGDRRLLSVPSFWISLKPHRRQPFVPTVGQSAYEGYYLKTAYNYMLSDQSFGAARLDLLQKRGIGAGVDHNYVAEGTTGALSVYHLRGRDGGTQEWTGRLTYDDDLGDDIKLRLLSDYRQNTYYYAAGRTMTNSQLSLTRNRPQAQSTLGFSHNTSQGFGTSRFLTANFRHAVPRSGGNWLFLSTFQRNTTLAGVPDNLELNAQGQWTGRWRDWDVKVVGQKRFDLDRDRYTGDNFFQALDRLPEITLTSQRKGLGHGLLTRVPVRLGFALGSYRENSTHVSAYRVRFASDVSPGKIALTKATSLSLVTHFEQSFYGDADHTAQYGLGGYADLQHQVARNLSAGFTYRQVIQQGYTPFSFDWIGEYRSAAGGLTYQAGSRMRASLLSGYDFMSNRWQNILFRADYRPHERFRLVTSASYNANQGRPGEIISQVEYDPRPELQLRLGSRYDAYYGKWRRAALSLAWQATPKWNLQAQTGWNGFTKQLVYNELLVTRDLHCWEARVSYSLQQDQVRVELRLKAFGWPGSDYGTGRFGQILDTSTGEVY